MPATLIDGKASAARLRVEIADETGQLAQRIGRPPGLHVILVGEDPASQVYVRNKEKDAIEVGFDSHTHKLAVDTSESELLALISELNFDPKVDGILVQLPLPEQINTAKVIQELDPNKDVDGFHPMNMGELLISAAPKFAPCTPKGVMRLLDEYQVPLKGANAVVVGRSTIVGKPIAQLLLARHATVTMCHSRTVDLPGVCRQADVLIVAIGRAGMVDADYVKRGATVIDVGISRTEAGLAGDVDFASVVDIAGLITPVPGGVGPMTRAELLSNTLDAYKLHNDFV